MKRIYMSILAIGIMSLPVYAHAEDGVTTPATSSASSSAVPHAGGQKLSPEARAAKKAEMKAKFQAMTPEQKKAAIAEHKAKKKARYDAATPEQQAKMKAHREKRMERMKAKRGNLGGGTTTTQ